MFLFIYINKSLTFRYGTTIFTKYTLFGQHNGEKNGGSHSHRSFCAIKKLTFEQEWKEIQWCCG